MGPGMLGLSGKIRVALWAVWYFLSLVLGKDQSSLPKPSVDFPYQEGKVDRRVMRGRSPYGLLHPGDGWRFQRAVEAARERVLLDRKRSKE